MRTFLELLELRKILAVVEVNNVDVVVSVEVVGGGTVVEVVDKVVEVGAGVVGGSNDATTNASILWLAPTVP